MCLQISNQTTDLFRENKHRQWSIVTYINKKNAQKTTLPKAEIFLHYTVFQYFSIFQTIKSNGIYFARPKKHRFAFWCSNKNYYFLANIYLFKANNRNTRKRCEIF